MLINKFSKIFSINILWRYLMDKLSAIDLFCGAGGLTHGFEKAGIPVSVGYDIDPACKFPYEFNNKAKFILKNVQDINGLELLNYFNKVEIKILVGCTPCQPFSTYSRRYKHNTKNIKWNLLKDFARLIKEVSPDIISMENVVELIKYEVFKDFTKELESNHYYLSYYIVNCAEYGIPQSRKRLVFFASKYGQISLISPTYNESNFQTVRQTIANLEPLKAGESSNWDPLHKCSNLSKLNLQRIKASKPGGTWKDWSEDLIALCHLKNTGKNYQSVYGRMEWDRPSPTITTQCFGFGNGRFGHPEQNRAISLREAALLQTFPLNYQFSNHNNSLSLTKIGRLIGNAVPVKLGEIVAQSILNHLNYDN